MKDRKYRITKETHSKMKKRFSIRDVVIKQFGSANYNVDNMVNEYLVQYELVKTKDLVEMLQRLTISNSFISYIKTPSSKMIDRLSYLDTLKDFIGYDASEPEFGHIMQLVSNQKFIENTKYYESLLRKELSTREHVPTKKDGKIIRRLKAQGKYIID